MPAQLLQRAHRDVSPLQSKNWDIKLCGLKNSEAPGVDNGNAEMLKANPAFTLNQLLNICNQTLDQCKAWPSDWRKAL